MLESAWLFIGLISAIATSGAVLTNDDALAIVLGIMGFFSWGAWTYGSLDVRVVGDSVTYSFTMPSVTLFGIIMLILPLYIALTGPIEAINSRVRNTQQEDV